MTKTETFFLSLGYGHCIEQTLDRQLRQLSVITGGQKQRVAALYRVSTKKQLSPSENGGDIPTQQIACHEFVEGKSGWEIVKEYHEKGVSGFKLKSTDRDVIQQVLYDAEHGVFDVLVVFMFDRLGRREDDTPLILQSLVGFGVEVWSVTEGQQRFDGHVDKLLNYIRFWQASGESYKTSIRVNEAHRQMVLEGVYRGGGVPFGYRTKPSGKFNKKGKELLQLEIDPDQVEIVRLMYRLTVEEGYGQNRIAQYFNQQGFKTNKGKPFASSVINSMIKNPLYKGFFVYGKNTEKEVYSRDKKAELVIVDEAMWQQAQEIRARRNPTNTKKDDQETVIRSTKGSLLLIGLIRCGHCGNALTTTWNKKVYQRSDGTTRASHYAKYRCSGKALKKVDCDGQTMHSQFKLESIVLNQVNAYLDRLATQDLSERIAEMQKLNAGSDEKELRKLSKQREAEQDKLLKYKSEVIKVINGESRFTADLLNGLIAETEQSIRGLADQIQFIQREMESKKMEEAEIQTLRQYVPVWREVFEQATDSKKKMMLAAIIGQFLGTMGCGTVKLDSHNGVMNGKVTTQNTVAVNE